MLPVGNFRPFARLDTAGIIEHSLMPVIRQLSINTERLVAGYDCCECLMRESNEESLVMRQSRALVESLGKDPDISDGNLLGSPTERIFEQCGLCGIF